jgi:hypothetical protein
MANNSNKTIITTTINQPTTATLKYCEIAKNKNWKFVIVGDTKTPHDSYKKLEENYKDIVFYLTPEKQDLYSRALSDAIGWRSIQRRNLGFVYAYHEFNTDIFATVDDDNIPYSNWGDDLYVDREVELDVYSTTDKNINVFDPLSITNHNDLWHRGYPVEFLNIKNNVEYLGKQKRWVLVQADFWDGDPDIDAICRLSKKPIVKFDKHGLFAPSDHYSPFNSQNTFLSRKVISKYAVLPHIGRMDDIWGGYITEYYFENVVAYNNATVYQERNPQDLVKNLENEIIGYRNTKNFIDDIKAFEKYLPEQTVNFWNIYRQQF